MGERPWCIAADKPQGSCVKAARMHGAQVEGSFSRLSMLFTYGSVLRVLVSCHDS